MLYKLTPISSNKKTGPIPVSMTHKSTCPPSCPLMDKGCYADGGPIAIHWSTLNSEKTGMPFDAFIKEVRKLPRSIWRYGQAGDLPGIGDEIDADQLEHLARANQGRPVIAYTHKPLTEGNKKALRRAEELGFHVNVSANKPSEADEALSEGFSVVTVLQTDYGRTIRNGEWTEPLNEFRVRTAGLPRTTPNGTRIAVCPATYTSTNCQRCGACAIRRPQNQAIGFPAHGNKARAVSDWITTGAKNKSDNDKKPGRGIDSRHQRIGEGAFF